MAENLILGLIFILTSFGPKFVSKSFRQKFFSWVLPLLYVIHCCKLSFYAISRKTNEPNFRKWQKNQFQAQFWTIWFWVTSIFFFKYLALSVTRYHGQVSSCTISEKTNNPISRKLCERQKDRQRDRLTDKSDFVGQTLSNVEHPKTKKLIISFFFHVIRNIFRSKK